MEKLSSIVSDFDDTLFFSRDAISAAARDIYNSITSKQGVKDYDAIMDSVEKIINDGKVPHGFDKTLKNQIYTLAYIKYSDRLLPNKPLINYIKETIGKNLEFVILSARGEEFRDKTEEALVSNGLTANRIILPDNHDLSDEHWKYLKLKELAEDYGHIILLEDKEENIRYIMDRLHNKPIDFYLVEGKTLKLIR